MKFFGISNILKFCLIKYAKIDTDAIVADSLRYFLNKNDFSLFSNMKY